MNHPIAILRLPLLGCLALGALFQGCASQPPPATAAAPRPAALAPSPFQALRKGMTTDEVRTQFGAPVRVEPFSEGKVKSEIWTYTEPVQTTTTQEATSVRQVEAVDPISGREFTVPEPVFQTVVLRLIETVKILIVEGQVVEWKTSRETTRNF